MNKPDWKGLKHQKTCELPAAQLLQKERDEAVESYEVLTENIGNCMDTIAQQDKEIERLEDVIKVLSRLLAEENEDEH